MPATACPFDGLPVEATEEVDGWLVYRPCGHPAPAPRPTLADMLGH